MRKGFNEKYPKQESSLGAKAVKGAGAVALTVAVMGGAGYYSFGRTSESIAIEKLTAGTSIYEGESKITETMPIKDIAVIGYTTEYTDIVVARKIESTIDLNKLNPLSKEENRLIATVDVNTESKISINEEKLGQLVLEVDEDNKTVEVNMSQSDLLVESYEQRNSRHVDIDQEGLNVRAKGAHDGAFNEGEFLDEDKNDLTTLAVDVALHQSDNRADEAIESNIGMLEDRITTEVIDYLDKKDEGYKVIINWADDGAKAEVVGKEEHEAALRSLGGDEIISEGGVELPDETGGKA